MISLAATPVMECEGARVIIDECMSFRCAAWYLAPGARAFAENRIVVGTANIEVLRMSSATATWLLATNVAEAYCPLMGDR